MNKKQKKIKSWIDAGVRKKYSPEEVEIIVRNTSLLTAESCEKIWLALWADRSTHARNLLLCTEQEKFLRYIYRVIIFDIEEEIKKNNSFINN